MGRREERRVETKRIRKEKEEEGTDDDALDVDDGLLQGDQDGALDHEFPAKGLSVGLVAHCAALLREQLQDQVVPARQELPLRLGQLEARSLQRLHAIHLHTYVADAPDNTDPTPTASKRQRERERDFFEIGVDAEVCNMGR